MKRYSDPDRTASLFRLIPDLYDHNSVLYVGARDNRFDYGEEFLEAEYEISVVEIFEANVSYLLKIPWIHEVYWQDVRNCIVPDTYDIIFWWHGPEHIPEKDVEDTLYKLEKLANIAVVIGCPWGKTTQRALYDNPHEKHVSNIYPELFEKRGYEVECLGDIDVKGSNITAVKYVPKV